MWEWITYYAGHNVIIVKLFQYIDYISSIKPNIYSLYIVFLGRIKLLIYIALKILLFFRAIQHNLLKYWLVISFR